MDGAITKYIDVVFDGDYKQVAPSVHRYDHGIAIRIRGVPTNVVWQCHFSCRGNETSIPSIAVKEGNAVVGVIPDIILMQPREVICYLYYEDNNFGRTVYEIFIPVRDRSKPADGSYTPQQIDVYDQLVAALHGLIDEVDAMNPVTQPALAPDYDDLTNNDFPVLAGLCCWHDDTLYKAKQNILTYESWTAAHWEEAVIGDDLAALSAAVTELESQITEPETVDLANTAYYSVLISSASDTWQTGTNRRCRIFAVDSGALSCTITANATNGSSYAFLTTNAHTDNTAPDYCAGTGRTFIAAGQTVTVPIPTGCQYIYLLDYYPADTSYLPASFQFRLYASPETRYVSFSDDQSLTAAQKAQALGNIDAAGASELAAVKSAVDGSLYAEKTGTFVAGKYIATNGDVGSTVDVENPVTSSGYSYCVIPCKNGDRFTVTASGGQTPRAWCFTDEDFEILSRAGNNAELNNAELVAEADGYLIVNSTNTHAHTVKWGGYINVPDSVAELSADIDALSETVGGLDEDVDELRGQINELSFDAEGSGALLIIKDAVAGTDVEEFTVNMAYAAAGRTSITINFADSFVFPDDQGHNTDNGFITNYSLTSTGGTSASNNFNVSEYVPVKPNTAYRLYCGKYKSPSYCLYNADKEFLTGQTYNNNTYRDFTTPATAAYIRVSIVKASPRISRLAENVSAVTVALGATVYGGTANLIDGTALSTLDETGAALVTPVSLEIDAVPYTFHAGTNVIYTLSDGCSLSARYKAIVTGFVESGFSRIDAEVAEIKDKISALDNMSFYGNSPYYRDVRWGCHQFNTHYHSADPGTSLFPNTTTAAQYFALFNALVADYPGYAEAHEMGKASDGETMMYYYTFTPLTNQDSATYKRPKIIVSAGQHGFEKTANFGVYWFAKNLLEDWQSNDFLAYVRNHVILILMPMLNPWGFDNDKYVNANGVNLNRNWDTEAWSSGTAGTTTYGGAEPFSEPETQYARDVILANLDALWLCDYHNNGQSAPNYPTGYLWHSFALVTYNDEYFKKAIQAAKWHIDDTTGHLYIDYPDNCAYAVSGTWTDNNAPSHQGLIVAYAREQGIMAATLEGGAAFIGSGNRYSSPIHHMNADLIGNWIRCLLACYAEIG